ncbi:MAG: hypothetical protein Rhims3KO_02750 [Hyphomicrobiales bacterium]
MAQSLQTLLEGIYSSVLEARKYVSSQHLRLFQSYFETKIITDPDTGDPLEVYTPRLLSLATSQGVGENETFEVIDAPVLALVPLHTLAIDTLEIEFEAKLTNLEVVKAKDQQEPNEGESEGHPSLIRRTIDDLFGTAAEISIMSKSDSFESSASPAKVKIVFKMTEPPEGVNLLQEQMLDYIRQQ